MNMNFGERHGLTRIFASILSIFVILAIAFPAAGGASAQEPPPSIRVSTSNNYLRADDFTPNATVTFTVYASQSSSEVVLEISRQADGSGHVFIDGGEHAADLVVDNYVVATDGFKYKQLVLEPLTIEVFDPDTNVVTGTASPGRSVWVVVGNNTLGYPWGMGVEANADGVWTANFAPEDEFTVDMWASAEVSDDDWDATVYHKGPTLPPPSPWRDEFNGSLAEGWYWPNGESREWIPDEDPEFLRIYTSASSTPAGNLLLRPVAPGDFMMKTRLLFEPDTNFQFAGLVIYQDGENFLQFGRAFCDVEGPCVGNGIYFDKALGGNSVDGNFARTVDDPSEAWLRLERRGDMVKAFYSYYDGITWFEIGTHWIPSDFQVNGVGLVASQNFFTPDRAIPADFDFFELAEGWDFLPDGFHDYDQGDVPSWACNAGGWAADPDDPAADLAVEIDVDGTALPDWLSASEYREDLDAAGVCVDGNCAFSTSLWGVISSYEPHSIVAYAQDIPSGEWVQLSSSPKTLTCRSYDIYAYDPSTGLTTQVTDLRDRDEYNPTWSPSGKKVAHDVVNSDGSHGIYITDVKTGASAPLLGAEEGGNDADWSPNGKWIVFDRRWYDDPNIYLVPATGGERQLVVPDAVSPGWAPNGKRLVFQNLDGTLGTSPVDGGQGAGTSIPASGTAPSWSPDGNWIAYENEGDIWKIAVNVQGRVLGEPIRLTSGAFQDGHPTWSADSATIVFSSGLSGDYDLWTVPAAGGDRTWLTGAPGFGDYDPAYARNGPSVAYGSFSPEGQAARTWGAAFTYDAGTWSEGDHSYYFESAYSVPEPGGGETTPPVLFTVSKDAPQYEGSVLLRGYALRARVGVECPAIEALLRPDQNTLFHYGWLTDSPMTYSEALAHFDSLVVKAYWDGGMTADLQRNEIFPGSSVDWDQYICSFTE